MGRLVACLLSAGVVALAGEPAFAPNEMWPVLASEHWIVWHPFPGLEAEALAAFAKEPYVVLQPRGLEATYRIPIPEGNAGDLDRVAVLGDGTLVFVRKACVVYARRGAPSRTEVPRIRGKAAAPVQAWPDGTLFRVPSKDSGREDASWFVPLREGALDYAAAVALEPEGPTGAFSDTAVRCGDVVAGAGFAYDLRKQVLLPFGAPLKRITAFDGTYATDDRRVTKVGGEGAWDAPKGHRFLVARYGRGYAVARTGGRLVLRAVPLAAAGGKGVSVFERPWPAEDLRVDHGAGVATAVGGKGLGFFVLWDEEGIVFWNGEAWTRRAWLR